MKHRRSNRLAVGARIAGVLALLLAAGPAWAADELCIGIAAAPPSRPLAAVASRLAEARLEEVRLTFVGHATFLIESPQGIRIATDYNDLVRPRVVPDIVTMNRAHMTHYSIMPDPAIRHVLRGWNPAGGAAHHDLRVGDVRVRNVPTNIRGGSDGTDIYGNSVFVFETAGLCIAHLGHLHHTLTTQQRGQIGRLDVALVPVDGSFTLDLPGMLEVLGQLQPRLILPMHYFSPATLNRFLDAARTSFRIEAQASPTIVVSRRLLPKQPTILVLPES